MADSSTDAPTAEFDTLLASLLALVESREVAYRLHVEETGMPDRATEKWLSIAYTQLESAQMSFHKAEGH